MPSARTRWHLGSSTVARPASSEQLQGEDNQRASGDSPAMRTRAQELQHHELPWLTLLGTSSSGWLPPAQLQDELRR